MLDLSKASGLPIKLDGDKLILGKGIKEVMPAGRLIDKMVPVLYDKSVKEPDEIYFMYRDVCLMKDLEIFSKHQVRYDITVIPAIMLGPEFNKTFGHFHDKVHGTDLSYTEIYEVLQGNAHCILQSEREFYVCEAKQGEKIVIPPNFGHVTINPTNEILVMANLVSSELLSDYAGFSEMQGAMYFETEDGFKENENYGVIH